MKILNITFLICLVLCLVSCNEKKQNGVVDNSNKENTRIAENSKDALKSSLLTFTQALIEPNEVVLDSITDNQLSYGHSSGLIQDKSEFIDDVLHGGFDFLTIDLSKQEIIYANNLAVVRHVFESKALNKGEEADVRIGVMLVWSFNTDRWKLIARQAYRLEN